MLTRIARSLLLVTTVALSAARAQDTFYASSVADLPLVGGALPPDPNAQAQRQWQMSEYLYPYAVLDGAGEVFVFTEGARRGWGLDWSSTTGVLGARVAEGAGATGTLYVPNADWTGLVPLRFDLARAPARADARRTFFTAKASHYERLIDRGIPGGGWFRRQADEARRILETEYNVDPAQRPRPFNIPELDTTYDLFTGGRAVSENLQLHRDITAAQPRPGDEQVPPEELVPVSSITGVTVRAMDFKTRLGESDPALDPLASAIPADQHAVFFPSFEALTAVADETSEDGLPLFRGLGARSEDARLIARYEHQLGLSTRGLARLLGPVAVKSIAITGSDSYFPTGTDVAVLMESANPKGLHDMLAPIVIAMRVAPGGVIGAGDVDGIAYSSIVTPDRAVSSYLAMVGETVVVTNSLHQLKRLAAVKAGAAPSLASLDEYRYFRLRYPRGDEGESAFAVLSDAAIRRWCGPEWRIGASRRLRAAAVLSDITAAHMGELVKGVEAPHPVPSEVPMRTIGQTSLTPAGARSSVYNTLAFLTPIAELGITEVTKDEAAAYERWRDTYQRNWRWAFDPIAIRLGVREDRLSADVTVMPLIFATQYATWMTFSQGAAIGAGSGDPHGALAHAVAAVNPESPSLKQATGFAMMMAPGIEVDPLGWLGQTVSLYADPDPFWGEMLADDEQWFEDNIFRLPIALRAEVKSPLKLTAFLASARAFIEQTSPGNLAWENRTHNGQAYVRVGLSEQARADAPEEAADGAVYYAPMPRAITLSLSEDVLKRAIEREQARRDAAGDDADAQPPASVPEPRPWLGESLALQFTREGLNLIEGPGGETLRFQMQKQCWNNLPILNEWRRLFPDKDPAKVHQQVWGVSLVCPASGTYAWNEPFRTMESTSLGHPGEPRPGPQGLGPLESITFGNLGVTFETDGLRGRAEIDRKP